MTNSETTEKALVTEGPSAPPAPKRVAVNKTALKTKNAMRDPRVSLCVLSDGFYGEWIQVDGVATVVSLPGAMEPLVDYYRSIRGEHPKWDEYRAAMENERRVIVRINLTRAGPDRSG